MSRFGLGFVGGTPVASFAYLGDDQNTSDLTTYTFTNFPLGDSTRDRLVVICVSASAGSNGQINSATIAGVSASINVTTALANTASIISAVIPASSAISTGTISITFSVGRIRCGIEGFALYDLQSTTPISGSVVNNDTANSGTFSRTITTAPGGVALGITSIRNSSGTPSNATWTGLALAHDQSMETFVKISVAAALTTGESLNVSHNGSGTSDARTSLIAFR